MDGALRQNGRLDRRTTRTMRSAATRLTTRNDANGPISADEFLHYALATGAVLFIMIYFDTRLQLPRRRFPSRKREIISRDWR